MSESRPFFVWHVSPEVNVATFQAGTEMGNTKTRSATESLQTQDGIYIVQPFVQTSNLANCQYTYKLAQTTELAQFGHDL